MKYKPRAIDLFSGCGGLTQGLKQAGFNVIGAVEIDEVAAETYETNHPDTKLWTKSIRCITAPKLLEALSLEKGELELLAGCPPCQGFSALTTLNGGYIVEDDQNDLIYDFLRLIRGVKPKCVMLENVPGLETDQRLKTFVCTLKKLNYKVNCDVLNAADYGVPQRRRRLILVASLLGKIPFARKARKRKTVASAIKGLKRPGKSKNSIHDLPEKRTDRIKKLIAKIPKNGGSRTDLPRSKQLKCHKKCDGFKDIYGRMSWDDVAPTITTGCFNPSKGRFLHPSQNRAITMYEAALLQTFPKSYKFPVERGKVAIAELIGNALPPEFVKRHAKSVRAHFESKINGTVNN